MKTQNHILMSRNFHFAGSVTYIENYYTSVRDNELCLKAL